MIRVENLTKYYGERLAVDAISFNVEQGEIVGFLGPNGAGKSTTMRMVTGFLMPTRGEVFVAGHDMTRDSLAGRRHLGYLPEIVPLYYDMTTRGYLRFAGRLRGLDKRAAARRVDEVIETCALQEYRDVILAKLSKGFRQRVGLAQSIIHDPGVLILDEPTIGIDPIQVAHTRALIKQLGENRTILLSSHILPEVSMVCQRVLIIHQGRIVAQDSIEHLSSTVTGGERLRLRVDGPAAQVSTALGSVEGVLEVKYQEPFHLARLEAGKQPQAQISAALVQRGWGLLAMENAALTLEDIFLELTGQAGTDEPGADEAAAE